LQLRFAQNDIRKWLLVLLRRDVGVNLLVVSAGIFFLSFSKWYVVSDTTHSGISPWIFFSHLDRHTDWSNPNATRPVKLDMPRPDILLGFLRGVSRVPSRVSRNTTQTKEHHVQNA
jgi:hypothetical protein